MYVRVKSTPNSPRKSVQIVESIRHEGRVKQRILRHIGVAEDGEQLQKLKELARYTLLSMQQHEQGRLFSAEEEAAQVGAARIQLAQTADEQAPLMVDLRQVRETSRVTTGFHEVYGQIYDQLGFDATLGRRYQASSRVLRDLVMARLAQPVSKLASARLLSRDFGIDMDVNQIYRMMDHLDEKVLARIQRTACQAALDLLNQIVDVVFFDCTTLYFESFDEDELRQKGFSKDHKSSQTQVLLALLVTQEGLPIGYRLYPGATWEGHTLKDAVEDLRTQFSVGQWVMVADSGLLCKENLDWLQTQSIPFIIAARLKQLNETLAQQVLDRQAYRPLSTEEQYLELPYSDNMRLIVTHSEVRARKDAHDRAKTIEKILNRYQGKSARSAWPGSISRFMHTPLGGHLQMDELKIAQCARWDGLHGIITNIHDIHVADALTHYRGLWQVEQTFRLSKHDLQLRPIFHWSAQRIQAHVAICFMALTCMRWLELNAKRRQLSLSPERIRNELAHVQVSILEDTHTKRRFAIPSTPTKPAQLLFKLVGKTLSDRPLEIPN